MKSKLTILSFAVIAALGSTAAFAQGPAGGSSAGAATISGSEVRAEQTRRTEPSTVGSGALIPESRTTAVTPNGTRVDTTVAPGGLVGAAAPDATAAAPAGR